MGGEERGRNGVECVCVCVQCCVRDSQLRARCALSSLFSFSLKFLSPTSTSTSRHYCILFSYKSRARRRRLDSSVGRGDSSVGRCRYGFSWVCWRWWTQLRSRLGGLTAVVTHDREAGDFGAF